tara:strand:- start:1533 stop:1928 length:396 start_codon:yes stop_codon:yes gene_type:complete
MKYKTDVEVRYQETDAMGVVHHSVYAVWFELARIRGLRLDGFAYEELEARGQNIPVIGLHVEYLKSVKFGHMIEIRMDIEQESRMKFRFVYEAYVGDQKVATGYTQHAFTNSQGQPIRPPQEFIEFFFTKD